MWHEVAEGATLGDDEAVGVQIGVRKIALCRTGGEFYAVDDVCTHAYALLSSGYVEDGCIECPLHQGRFDLKTGAPLCAPVTEPVRTYAVRSEGGKVFVEIPE